MEQSTGIERIRTATFTIARRGYEKREVEQFLGQIADWLETGGGDQARSDIVKRELERVGERTAGILATAQDSAVEIRAEAEDEAAEITGRADAAAEATRNAADDYARKTRAAADEYSAKTREGADAYSAGTCQEADEYAAETRGAADADAEATLGAAEAKARRIVDEGTARRRDIETVIADLVARRDAVIAEANRLAAELRRVSDSHRPDDGADRFAEPAALDPAERVKA